MSKKFSETSKELWKAIVDEPVIGFSLLTIGLVVAIFITLFYFFPTVMFIIFGIIIAIVALGFGVVSLIIWIMENWEKDSDKS